MQKQRFVGRGAYKGRTMAVLTSGGDAQGMNAAVRAVVRVGIYLGCKVYFIREGYQGMVDGNEFIEEAKWFSVSSIIHQGGTIIGSARCPAFTTREGRLKAAYNLVMNQITNLVVIGGDGTLSGANILRFEWSGLLDELLQNEEITEDQRLKSNVLQIVGLVGSIDNDFVGTERTIGTDSALHRIVKTIDAIADIAHTHYRTFIFEVMGRHCGYLAVCAGLATGAGFIFIPEDPVEINWQSHLCNKLVADLNHGKKFEFVIVAEGAIDRSGQPVTAQDIKKVIVDELQLDARITVLGHIQRGGSPSAFDRILGCRMGTDAVLALMETTENSVPCVVALDGNQTIRVPLMKCIDRVNAVKKAMEDKNWELTVKLRGRAFERNLKAYRMLSRFSPGNNSFDNDNNENKSSAFRLAVMHIGAPACGMNAAVRSFVRNCVQRGVTALGIQDGIEGLIAGKIKEMEWTNVDGWVRQGGCNLGTKRTLPEKYFKEIAARFKEYKIQGLLIIGGFEAYHACGQLFDQRSNFREFCIPLVVIPSTISNNVPGTDYSLGSDTGLNEITEICDRIRQSAQGIKRRVFIVETMGGYCGYLATMAGLAGGADVAYIFEEKFNIKDLQEDVDHMISKMEEGVQRGLIIRNERANLNYNSDFLHRLFSEEGKDKFTCRVNILGHLQQGRICSPFDRNLGTKMGEKCVKWLLNQLKKNEKPDKTIGPHNNLESVCLIGLICRRYVFTPLHKLVCETNFENRLPRKQWWLKLRPLLRVISKHKSAFSQESVFFEIDEECGNAEDDL